MGSGLARRRLSRGVSTCSTVNVDGDPHLILYKIYGFYEEGDPHWDHPTYGQNERAVALSRLDLISEVIARVADCDGPNKGIAYHFAIHFAHILDYRDQQHMHELKVK